MNQKMNLRELKGAPLSIILAIMITGNRTVSVSYLCTETGYSDKTISSGIELLRNRQIITETQRNRYQLTGENLQLPLYWGEEIEPADPSPASDQLSLFDMGSRPEKIFPKKSVPAITGNSPESGEIPELKRRISALEDRMAVIESENFPKTGEIPENNGEIPTDLIKSSSELNTVIDIEEDDDQYREEFLTIFREYEEANGTFENKYAKIHGMFSYSDEELDQLIREKADPELVDFVLPAASSFDAALSWLKMDIRSAKKKLCKKFGIYDKLAEKFAQRDDISLKLIQYHYWKWRLTETGNPKITLGTVISRIDRTFDVNRAETEWPMVCGYLD